MEKNRSNEGAYHQTDHQTLDHGPAEAEIKPGCLHIRVSIRIIIDLPWAVKKKPSAAGSSGRDGGFCACD